MRRILLWIALSTVMIMLELSGSEKTISVNVDPSLPIVRDHGIISIEVYPNLHKLTVLMYGQTFKTYSIAVGSPSTPTPVGEYQVISKGIDWGPAFGPRWLGLNVPWGIYGIHGTNKPYSIGQHLSHGCIRMKNKDIKELFEMIPLGTKVNIFGHILGDPNHEPRKLAEGDVGGDVHLNFRPAGWGAAVWVKTPPPPWKTVPTAWCHFPHFIPIQPYLSASPRVSSMIDHDQLPVDRGEF
jgi:hypothetical protein